MLDKTHKQTTLFKWDLMKHPIFILIGFATFFYFSGFSGLSISIPSHAQDLGFSRTEGAFLISIVGIADLFGRVSAGWFADLKLIKTSYIIMLAELIACVSAALLTLSSDYIWLCVWCAFLGMSTGAFAPMLPSLLAEVIGADQLASSMGLIGLFTGCGVLVSPPTVGHLRDIYGKWDVSFYFMSGMFLLCSIVIFFEPIIHRFSNKELH